jgi:hypothetical protein
MTMGPLLSPFLHHLREILALASAGFFCSTVGFAALWIRARERAARAESLLEGMRMMGARETMPAIDAIAEEVERIGEGQRYLTRLMAEQANRASMPAPRPSGAITPH